ncbi:hypothetical protein AB0C77_03470 [Streptomyces sp. NPDC048629]|uniref:hypothetical protein n=1 Tax=Streptomyces sp. NPDC048629 TaxID=3154824 RepID=UPI0034433E73
MYGHGYPPPQQHRPSQGVLVGLRVLFVAVAMLSCGFLAFAPLIRLAVVTRRKLDWVLFGVFLAADIALLTYIGVTAEEKGSDLEAFIGVGTMMALVVGSVSYYLVAEIQHYAKTALPTPALPTPAGPPPVTGGYGYPATSATVPSPGYPQPMPHAHPMPVPPPPQPQPPAPPAQPPAQPAAASHSQPRIDQVRAELDELSDLLRKEEGK